MDFDITVSSEMFHRTSLLVLRSAYTRMNIWSLPQSLKILDLSACSSRPVIRRGALPASLEVLHLPTSSSTGADLESISEMNLTELAVSMDPAHRDVYRLFAFPKSLMRLFVHMGRANRLHESLLIPESVVELSLHMDHRYVIGCGALPPGLKVLGYMPICEVYDHSITPLGVHIQYAGRPQTHSIGFDALKIFAPGAIPQSLRRLILDHWTGPLPVPKLAHGKKLEFFGVAYIKWLPEYKRQLDDKFVATLAELADEYLVSCYNDDGRLCHLVKSAGAKEKDGEMQITATVEELDELNGRLKSYESTE
jgi:hypothetical protein